MPKTAASVSVNTSGGRKACEPPLEAPSEKVAALSGCLVSHSCVISGKGGDASGGMGAGNVPAPPEPFRDSGRDLVRRRVRGKRSFACDQGGRGFAAIAGASAVEDKCGVAISQALSLSAAVDVVSHMRARDGRRYSGIMRREYVPALVALRRLSEGSSVPHSGSKDSELGSSVREYIPKFVQTYFLRHIKNLESLERFFSQHWVRAWPQWTSLWEALDICGGDDASVLEELAREVCMTSARQAWRI